MIEFFLPMVPPTVTAQERKVAVTKGGRPRFYEPPRLADARAKLLAHLSRYAPAAPLEGALLLTVSWSFPEGRHPDGAFKATRPDLDNLFKLLLDCMTRAGFWKDDAQVAALVAEKRWRRIPGIAIRIEELPE